MNGQTAVTSKCREYGRYNRNKTDPTTGHKKRCGELTPINIATGIYEHE